MESEMLELRPGARNVINEARGEPVRVLPLNVEQYHGMIDAGILEEDAGVELLDGMLVPKNRADTGGAVMVVGEKHAYVVNQLAALGRQLDPARHYIQTQQPIVIAEADSEPEPDAALVLRPLSTPAKPAEQEVSCVIEVAGSSLERDRSTKLRLYAWGGIPQYIIIDIAGRRAEQYRHPDRDAGTYGECRTFAAGDSLRLDAGGEERLEVVLASLLPPPPPS